MNEIDKLAWVCIKDKHLLTARSTGKDIFYIPGGKREQGESDAAALIREIKEELLVDLSPATIEYVETFKTQAHDKPAGTTVKVSCYRAEFNGKLQANAEIAEIRWLSFADKEKCSAATQNIMEWLKAKGLIA